MRFRIGLGVLAVFVLLVAASPLPAADKQEIKAAIDAGVAYLKQSQREDGAWPYKGEEPRGNQTTAFTIGATALAGLTLLECDVPADDPIVEKAANFVRRYSISLAHTYALSLTIMFLDRLGDAEDVRLIQSMGIRLLAGQNGEGGWTYECPNIDAEEVQRLQKALQQRTELRTKRSGAAKSGDPKQRSTVPKEVLGQLRAMKQRQRASMDDHSNTQFAILALWVARRHGLAVEEALALTERRFRACQNRGDGGWSYKSVGPFTTPAMTCAGLLALAVGHGAALEAVLRTAPTKTKTAAARAASDPARDPAVRAGLTFLARVIGQPTGKKNDPSRAAARRQLAIGPYSSAVYALWSLERVAVIYDLTTIGNKDWYGWGAELLLDVQSAEGAWSERYSPAVDTSFALLFLRRANLARDLTATLKGKVKDPGEVRLTARGNGGDKPAARSGNGEDEPKTGTPVGKNPPAKTDPGKPPSTETSRPDDDPATVARLSDQLVKATSAEQGRLVEEYRDTKGAVYTDALAAAIPQLAGESKSKARDALAERLTRMSAKTLRDKLKEESSEIRRAACLACAMKEDKQHIPDLLAALEDREMSVILAARTGLKHLTKQDFGPRKDATELERAKAVLEWKAWHQNLRADEARSVHDPAIEAEIKKLRGIWTVVSIEQCHSESDKPKTSMPDTKVVFDGSTMKYQPGTASPRYTLGITTAPKTIDLAEGKGTVKGIYVLDADGLVIRLAGRGKQRPADFTAKPGPGDPDYVMVLRRGELSKEQLNAVLAETQKLQGTWSVIALFDAKSRQVGVLTDKRDAKMYISGSRCTLELKGQVVSRGHFLIDPSKKPSKILVFDSKGASSGVYELTGNRIRLNLISEGTAQKSDAANQSEIRRYVYLFEHQAR